MIDVVVFCGPTIPPVVVRDRLTGAGLRVDIRPPVSQGDAVRAWLETRTTAVAIIDGYFDRVPAVWHKELLWLLDRGVAVYGASSMGALRAAELHSFGMRGVGEIFEQFRDGVLTDDDEVAVLHASADDDYRCISTAMVDLRAGFLAAAENGLIDPKTATHLISVAKGLHYRSRSAPAVLAAWSGTGIDGSSNTEIDSSLEGAAESSIDGSIDDWIDVETAASLREFFRSWPGRKRLDAELLLDVLIADTATASSTPASGMPPTDAMAAPTRASRETLTDPSDEPPLATWSLSHTVFLDALLHDVERTVAERTEAVTSDSSYITLAGETPPVLRKQALLRVLATEAAHRLGIEPTEVEIRAVMANFRKRYGLLTDESVRTWLSEADWHWDGFVAAMVDLAVVEKMDRIHKFEIEPRLTSLIQFGRARAALDYDQTTTADTQP